jgi:hypothetical protein
VFLIDSTDVERLERVAEVFGMFDCVMSWLMLPYWLAFMLVHLASPHSDDIRYND